MPHEDGRATRSEQVEAMQSKSRPVIDPKIHKPYEAQDSFIRCILCANIWPCSVDQALHQAEKDDGIDVTIRPSHITATEVTRLLSKEQILQFFEYGHLPPHLAAVSMPFCHMARQIIETLPRNPERTVALRKLLESKDAAVRAFIAKPE